MCTFNSLNWAFFLHMAGSKLVGTAGQYNLFLEYQVVFFRKDLNLGSSGYSSDEFRLIHPHCRFWPGELYWTRTARVFNTNWTGLLHIFGSYKIYLPQKRGWQFGTCPIRGINFPDPPTDDVEGFFSMLRLNSRKKLNTLAILWIQSEQNWRSAVRVRFLKEKITG